HPLSAQVRKRGARLIVGRGVEAAFQVHIADAFAEHEIVCYRWQRHCAAREFEFERLGNARPRNLQIYSCSFRPQELASSLGYGPAVRRFAVDLSDVVSVSKPGSIRRRSFGRRKNVDLVASLGYRRTDAEVAATLIVLKVVPLFAIKIH